MNLHGGSHQNLNLARLPIPPYPHGWASRIRTVDAGVKVPCLNRLAIAQKIQRLSPLHPKGWVEGLEPSVSRTTIWRVNQLHYTHHINYSTKVYRKGFEPPTHGLEGRCSIQLSYRYKPILNNNQNESG